MMERANLMATVLIPLNRTAMDNKFRNLIENLAGKYEELMAMVPLAIDNVPSNCPTGGVYLFTENGVHLYTGRTKRRIKERLKNHVSSADDCPFAWRLAREKTGNIKASYKTRGSRKHLLSQPEFKQAYEEAKNRIRQMEIRYVSEPDPLKQTLLEVYVAVVSNAKYNDFDTH
jgi:hypothetical protein